MTKTEKLLRELIALPSVNPAFLPANDPNSGEKRVAEFLAAVAARSGLSVEFRPVLTNRANLIATYQPPSKAKRRIVLAPHMDTVGAPGAVFTPQLKGNRLYGRGASDTKGSVAAMLSAIIEVIEARTRPKQTEIVFISPGLLRGDCRMIELDLLPIISFDILIIDTAEFQQRKAITNVLSSVPG